MTMLVDVRAACARQAGLEQRARLLDAIWRDIAGERRSVGNDVLPSRIVPHGPLVPVPLSIYAADLIDGPDGVYRVARDYVGPHPGVDFLQAPRLAVFLPALCRALLGETLFLPSRPVWWFGDSGARTALSAWPARLWIRDGLDPDSPALAIRDLSSARRHRLQLTVDRDPDRFIAGLSWGSTGSVEHIRCEPPGRPLRLLWNHG